MKVEDYFTEGRRKYIHFLDKRSQDRRFPCHRHLAEFLDDYIAASGIADDLKGPLFRVTRGKSGELFSRRLSRKDAWAMVK